MTDDTISTLSREDALTLECDDTDEEMKIETFIVDVSDDEEMDYPDSDSEPGDEEEDVFWPSDEQVAAWEEEDGQWRNPDALWGGEGLYDPAGEI